MNPKIKELAEKLLALAKRGDPGERDNAQKMLERHLKKNGLTMADLESESRVLLQIPADDPDPQIYGRFIVQIVASVVGSKRTDQIRRFTDGKLITFEIEVDYAESIEVKAKLDFFWNDFAENFKLFFAAYVQKNELYSNVAIDGYVGKSLTDNRAKIYNGMRDLLQKQTYRKQIGGK